MNQYKQPVSVLVVIYTASNSQTVRNPSSSGLILNEVEERSRYTRVLVLERADHPGFWQSVTGSREQDESLVETAMREVREETGLDATQYRLIDWNMQNVYEIYPQWRFRYPPGIVQNTEHVFSLELPHEVEVLISRREHLNYKWLAWQDAAEAVFSPSNRAAILQLQQHIAP